MPRVKRGLSTHKRHAALLERAKGFRGNRKNLFRRANEALMKADQFAYRDRRTKKRQLRRGWIVRINAAARAHGLSYSVFMKKLKDSGIELNRKVLSEMAINETATFAALAKSADTAAKK